MAAEERITPIGDLKPGMKNVNCIFIIIDRGSTQQIKDGSLVRKCRVADRMGSIMFSVWNEEAEAVDTGDIIRLTRGYASLWKGSLVLYCGKYGTVEKLGEFTMVYSETPDMSIVVDTPIATPTNTPPNARLQTQDPSSPSCNNDRPSNHTPYVDAPSPVLTPPTREYPHNPPPRGNNNFGPSPPHPQPNKLPPTLPVHPPHNHPPHPHHLDNRTVMNGHGDNGDRRANTKSHNGHITGHMTGHVTGGPHPSNRHHPYHRREQGWR